MYNLPKIPWNPKKTSNVIPSKETSPFSPSIIKTTTIFSSTSTFLNTFVSWASYIASVLLKVGISPSKKNCVTCFIESPLKIVKNAFYFILKLLSFSRYLSFCHDFWSCRKNGLIRKIRLTSKFMTSQPG